MSRHAQTRRPLRLVLAGGLAAAAATAVSFGTAPAGHATAAVGFAPRVFVDSVRAGGEPGIIHSSRFGTLVYSSHEGTTHIDRVGIASQSTQQFLCPGLTTADCYKNHVWIWTSEDNGAHWTLRDEGPNYQGFSDPDLTEDAGGAIYDTGIDLANDSVFASLDGGKTWPHGTVQCHEGDRPWLAGGVAGEVFMTTDDALSTGSGHTLFHSTNYADSCGSTGIADFGSWHGKGSYSGFGKGIYDRFDGSFIEPAEFTDANGSMRVGISRLADAAKAFSTGQGAFEPQDVADTNGIYSPFGAPQVISMDSAENIYFAWDTDDRVSDPNNTGGCNHSPAPLPNHIMLEIGKHTGKGTWEWLPPISLAHQGNARVLWPWSVAGSDGNVSVVWYQMDKMVDPDCDQYNGATIGDVKTYIYEAHITDATTPKKRQITVTNASGTFIHQGGICDSGTACVATGQDRRLGDYFTNAVDGNGCVLIASGDTTVPDPLSGQDRITSLPIFIRQNSGPSLTGGECTANPSGVAGATAAASPSSSSVASPSAGTSPGGAPPATALPNTAAGAGAGAGGAAVAAILASMGVRRRRPGA